MSTNRTIYLVVGEEHCDGTSDVLLAFEAEKSANAAAEALTAYPRCPTVPDIEGESRRRNAERWQAARHKMEEEAPYGVKNYYYYDAYSIKPIEVLP